MDLKKTAEQLLIALSVEPTDRTIKNVQSVLETIKSVVDMSWEQSLAEKTDELLVYYKAKCPKCGEKITVTRGRNWVEAKQIM